FKWQVPVNNAGGGNVRLFGRTVGFLGPSDFAASYRLQNESLTGLRIAVIGSVENLPFHFITAGNYHIKPGLKQFTLAAGNTLPVIAEGSPGGELLHVFYNGDVRTIGAEAFKPAGKAVS